MRNGFGILVAAALVAASGGSMAQEWPQRPIRIVGPGAPGGASEILARIIGEPLGRQLGQNMVFENKPGPGGMLAAQTVLLAEPNGYTFLFTTAATHGILPAIQKSVPFDVVKDFAPIARAVAVPQLMYVNNATTIQSVKDLVAQAKASPGKLNFGSLGQGTSTHLAMELFQLRTGIQMVHVPFKGSAPELTAVMAGDVQIGMDLLPGVISQAKSGGVRPIAVSTSVRSPELPNVPTVAESGIPGFEVSSWYGFVAKTGTPQAVVDRFAAELAKTMKDPAVLDRLRTFGAIPAFLPPAEFAAYIRQEVEKWPPVVKAAGMQPQ